MNEQASNTTEYSKIVITDGSGLKRSFTGINVGDSERGDWTYYVTDDRRVIVHGDEGQIDIVVNPDIEQMVFALADSDPDIAGGIAEALGLDIEVPL